MEKLVRCTQSRSKLMCYNYHDVQKAFCPDDGIGIRVGLRSQILRVRVSLGAPNFGDVAQW